MAFTMWLCLLAGALAGPRLLCWGAARSRTVSALGARATPAGAGLLLLLAALALHVSPYPAECLALGVSLGIAVIAAAGASPGGRRAGLFFLAALAGAWAVPGAGCTVARIVALALALALLMAVLLSPCFAAGILDGLVRRGNAACLMVLVVAPAGIAAGALLENDCTGTGVLVASAGLLFAGSTLLSLYYLCRYLPPWRSATWGRLAAGIAIGILAMALAAQWATDACAPAHQAPAHPIAKAAPPGG